MAGTSGVTEKGNSAPADNPRSNVIVLLGVALCGVVFVIFPYYAGYGSGWSRPFFFLGYTSIGVGFLFSAAVSSPMNVGRGMVTTSGALLFIIVGLDFWVASLGRDTTAGSVVELVILLLACVAILLAAVGFSEMSQSQQRVETATLAAEKTRANEGRSDDGRLQALEQKTPAIIAVVALLTAIVQFVVAVLDRSD